MNVLFVIDVKLRKHYLLKLFYIEMKEGNITLKLKEEKNNRCN